MRSLSRGPGASEGDADKLEKGEERENLSRGPVLMEETSLRCFWAARRGLPVVQGSGESGRWGAGLQDVWAVAQGTMLVRARPWAPVPSSLSHGHNHADP